MRFVDKTGPCWLWTGAANESGYGVLTWNKRVERAHRISYVIHKGPIPSGAMIRHRCDNPPCVNPDHLEPGTAADNSADMVVRGRSIASGICGERHGMAKLTESQVLEIRAAAESGASTRSLAQIYRVSRNSVRNIVTRRNWSHIP